MSFKVDPEKLRQLIHEGKVEIEVSEVTKQAGLTSDDILDALREFSISAVEGGNVTSYDRDYDRGRAGYDRIYDRTRGRD